MWNDRRKILIFVGLTVVALGAAYVWLTKEKTGDAVPVSEIRLPRQELELRDGHLARKSGGGPFTGVMFEQSADGRLLTEVPVKDGRVHGVARGWHENKQLEVEEAFENGVSHGVRTRWYPNGNKRNTATIVRGVLEGHYSEWHENGQLAVKMVLVKGKGEGLCTSWLPDGQLKSQVTLKDGQPINTELLVSEAGSGQTTSP